MTTNPDMETEAIAAAPAPTATEYPRCVVCGGWGLGLITNPQKICTHCARCVTRLSVVIARNTRMLYHATLRLSVYCLTHALPHTSART